MKHYQEFLDKDFANIYVRGRKTRSDSKKVRQINNNLIFTFDIEVTSFEVGEEKFSYPYIWQMCINGHTYYGRYLGEFKIILDKLNDPNCIQICWVHNLGYEFQFLRNLLKFDKVFARTKRKPIFARYKNIEFRCSYFLSNMSLYALSKSYDLEHKKQKDDLNYVLPRNSLTPLTAKEFGYGEYDVLALHDYIKYLLSVNGGKYSEIPYTQTGFVRKAMLTFVKEKKEYYALRKLVERIHPDMETFLMLEQAFAGGITHASFSAVLAGVIENAWSYDRRSSYPAVMASCKYPMTKFFKVVTNFFMYIHNEKYAWVAKVRFKNIEAKYDMCTISKHKCHKVSTSKLDGEEIIPDSNGRIYKAEEIVITITDVDFYAIEDMYTFDYEILEMRVSKYGYLPKVIVEFILEHYKNKTELKNVPGKEDLYMWSKQYINSCFGDMVMNPFCDDITYDNEDGWGEIDATPDKLESYYENPKTIKVYQWGVWITAHARKALIDGLVRVKNDSLYSDTDSIKGEGEHAQDFEELNAQIRELNKKAAEHFELPYELWKPKSPDGEEQELGTWDFEGDYEQFKALGAKRYAYVQNGEIHATVAGSPKGAIESAITSLDEFENGLCMSGDYDEDGNNESHKITMTYRDDVNKWVTLTDYNNVSERVYIAHCIHASGATFFMKRSPDYIRFLAENNVISDKKHKIRKGVWQ